MDDHDIELRRLNGGRVLRVLSKGKVVLELAYYPPVIEPPLDEDFITSFAEAEDFDFGLFLFNISRDRSRLAPAYG